MDLAENRFRKTWERFLEVLKVDCHVSVSAILYSILKVKSLMKDLKEIIPSLYLDVWLRWVLKLSVG